MAVEPKYGGLLPKTMPLRGSLHAEWKTCGKANCRCGHAQLHGPYFYRRWREGRRQRKAYVPRQRVDEVERAIARWRNVQAPVWSVRQTLAELRRMEHEVSKWVKR